MGIRYRGTDEAVAGWFSQIGQIHQVHHLWGMHACVCVCVCVHVHVCVCTYVCVHMCVYVCMCVHILRTLDRNCDILAVQEVKDNAYNAYELGSCEFNCSNSACIKVSLENV